MRSMLRLVGAAAALSIVGGAALALVRIDIDLSTQRMHVLDQAGESFDWPISSGRAGHRTPLGTFRPIALYPMVHSAKYGNAPMPHSIFFLRQYAIHGTDAVRGLGHTASHGCIRLAPRNAAALYAIVERERAVIHIHGAPAQSGLRVAAERLPQIESLAYAPHKRANSRQRLALAPAAVR